jgi:hypothetical protein
MKTTDRQLELSAKLIEMGQALMKEGKEKKDFTITQTGSCMIFLGGLMLDEKDIVLFGQICSMYSAKKILENMQNTNHDYAEYLKQKSQKESYADFIKRINKMREDNGLTPLE